MELYERLDLSLINYLNKLDFENFKPLCNPRVKTDSDRRIQFNILKNFCAINIKAKGEVRRMYSYTVRTPIEVGGRLYCGNSIQSLSYIIRGFLCKNMTDIDMRSAHLVIAKYLCRKHNIDCPHLSYYIDNRDEILSRFDATGKQTFLAALNNDKLNKLIKDPFFISFDKECKNIQTSLIELAEYKHIVETVPLDRTHNWNGSGFNRILCVFENKILQQIITVINSKNIEIAVLMFDGLMVYGDYYANANLLMEIETHLSIQFPTLNMKLSYKQHDTSLCVDEEIEIYNAEQSNDDCYASIKSIFEKSHAKIINKALFTTKTDDDGIILSTSSKFKTSYEHLKYTNYATNPPSQQGFITKWFIDENILSYDDIGIFPPPLVCPKNIFNIWRPFAIAKYIDEYEKDDEGLNLFLFHLKILCGNDDAVVQYLIKWLAQMFQYPATKTMVPTFIGQEGSGKGSILELLGRMMGNKKSLVTTSPSRDVWGSFNGLMSDCFLVNLNEMSKKEAQDAEGRIKGLITDPQLTINRKGIDSYTISSFHRFIITTNSEDPISTKTGDRRNLIIRSSDEKIGDIAYFTKLHTTLNKLSVMRTIYDYLMDIPEMDNFGFFERPTTEYQNDMKIVSRSPYDRWLEDFVRDNENELTVKMLGKEQYESFKNWCVIEQPRYETSPSKMAIAIKRLNIDGVRCGIKGKRGNYTIYDIPKLKQHYLIGIMINPDLNEPLDVLTPDYD